MPQELLLSNINTYLQTNEGKYSIANGAGACMSLSILLGTMSSLGNLDFWKEILVIATNWDKDLDKLDNEIILKSKPNEKYTLRKLIEKVSDHTIFHHASAKIMNQLTVLNGMSQSTLLSPNDNSNDAFFQALDNENNLVTVKDRKFVLSDITENRLDDLLNSFDKSNDIFLLMSKSHTIHVRKNNNKWFLYDPNYDHTEEGLIEKSFADMLSLKREIQNILGDTILSQVVSFKGQINLPESASETINFSCIENNNLYLVMNYTPEHLIPLLEMAEAKGDDGMDIFSNAILEALKDAKKNHLLIDKYAEIFFTKLVDAAIQKPETGAFLIKTLALFQDNGVSDLSLLAKYAPNKFHELIDFILSTDEGKLIIDEIFSIDDNNSPLLHLCAEFSPKCLSKILNSVAETDLGRTWLIRDILRVDSNDNTGFQLVLRHASASFPELLQLISSSEGGRDALIAFINSSTKQGWSGLQLILQYAPSALPQVLDILKQSNNDCLVLAQALVQKNNENISGLQMACRTPDFIKLIELAAQSDSGRKLIVDALTQHGSKNNTGVNSIAYHAPKELIKTAKLACQSQEDKLAIIQAMKVGNKDGLNTFTYTALIHSSFWSDLITFISTDTEEHLQLIDCLLDGSEISTWQFIENYSKNLHALLDNLRENFEAVIKKLPTEQLAELGMKICNSTGEAEPRYKLLKEHPMLWSTFAKTIQNEIQTRLDHSSHLNLNIEVKQELMATYSIISDTIIEEKSKESGTLTNKIGWKT